MAQQITDQDGDYPLGLKANQPTLLAGAERHITNLPASQAHTRWAYARDGVPVRYQVRTQTDLRWGDEQGRWPGRQTLIWVETSRHPPQGQPEPIE